MILPLKPQKIKAEREGSLKGAVLRTLPDGSVLLRSSRLTLGSALLATALIPFLVGLVLIDRWVRGGAFPIDTTRGWVVLCLVLLGFTALAYYFLFRWREVIVGEKSLILRRCWRGGLRTTQSVDWAGISRLGLVDWEDLALSFNVQLQNGQLMHYRFDALPDGFEEAMNEALVAAPISDRVRQMLSEAMAERQSYRADRNSISASALPPEILARGIVENTPSRLHLVIFPARSQVYLAAIAFPATIGMLIILAGLFRIVSADILPWFAGAGLALSVVAILSVLHKREEIQATPGELKVRRGFLFSKKHALNGKPVRVAVVSEGYVLGPAKIHVYSESGDEVSFGRALSGAYLNYVQARLGDVWGFNWLPEHDDSKFGDYIVEQDNVEAEARESNEEVDDEPEEEPVDSAAEEFALPVKAEAAFPPDSDGLLANLLMLLVIGIVASLLIWVTCVGWQRNQHLPGKALGILIGGCLLAPVAIVLVLMKGYYAHYIAFSQEGLQLRTRWIPLVHTSRVVPWDSIKKIAFVPGLGLEAVLALELTSGRKIRFKGEDCLARAAHELPAVLEHLGFSETRIARMLGEEEAESTALNN